MAQVGVEPTASFVLSEGGLPIAYRADFHFGFVIADFGFKTSRATSFIKSEF